MNCDNCNAPSATKHGNLYMCDKCATQKRMDDAAPELLKALEVAVAVWERAEREKPLNKSHLAFPPIWIVDSRAAIAKATGKS